MISHPWGISSTQAVALQRDLAKMVRIEPIHSEIRTIAGVDCAFTKDGRIIAAAVLCDARNMTTLSTADVALQCEFPYIPGLLSFREAPAVIAAVEKLPARPDLLMCDGQGIAHPRGLGLACHVGLWLDLPTIGVAKSRLVGDYQQPGLGRGARTDLLFQEKIVGSVLRTRDNVKPLFISVGHEIVLQQAVDWVLQAGAGYRLPEPTRKSDKLVAQLKQQNSRSKK